MTNCNFKSLYIADFVYRLLRPESVSGVMEHALQHRDRVGVQDFVLLEDYRSEAAFIDNLRKRFTENLIYVSFLLCFPNHTLHTFTVRAYLFDMNSIA